MEHFLSICQEALSNGRSLLYVLSLHYASNFFHHQEVCGYEPKRNKCQITTSNYGVTVVM